MAISLQHVNPAGIRVFMGTLTGDADVHEALNAIARQHDVLAGTVKLLGGLNEVIFTAFDFTSQQRLPPLAFRAGLEIVAGHGTISVLDDAPHVHIHLTITFRDEDHPHGIAVVGGHVARASAFAVEFTLTTYDGAPVHRAYHADTGLKLWKLPPLDT